LQWLKLHSVKKLQNNPANFYKFLERGECLTAVSVISLKRPLKNLISPSPQEKNASRVAAQFSFRINILPRNSEGTLERQLPLRAKDFG